LGRHNGLPVTIIVSTTLRELESARGSAVTAGGTLLPMADVIRMATHAHHYLTIFDKGTGESLYLGRTRRCASPGQRIMLLSTDRGGIDSKQVAGHGTAGPTNGEAGFTGLLDYAERHGDACSPR
jgi:Domain of unknown function (DUF222)